MSHATHRRPSRDPVRRRRRALRACLALLFALLLHRPAGAQIALVQSSGLFGNPAGTTASSTAFPANTKLGDTIIVLLWTWTQNTPPNIAITDNEGNVYTTNASATILQSGNWYESAEIYSAIVGKTGANFTVTTTLNGNDSASQTRGVVLEYSGVGSLDQANAVTGTATSASVSTLKPTQVTNELVVADFGIDNPADLFTSISASSGYTIQAYEYQNAGDTAGAGATATTSSTGVQTATFKVSPTLSGWAAAIATFEPAVLPDHFAISNAGTAVNCAPSNVTITAMTATQTPDSTTATITISTSTGHGDWSLVTGAGTFTPGASNSGTATYSYAPADAGAVTLALRDTYPETVSINVADGAITQNSGTALPSQHQPLTFVGSGFITTNGANVATAIGTQVAGVASTQSLALQAVRTDTRTGACTSVFASGTTVKVGLALQCNNPSTCVNGQSFTVTSNGTSTAIALNPASGVSSYTSVPLKFSTANAEAPITINYSDVGQVTLLESYNVPLQSGAGSGNLMTGSSQFVVQPYTLALSNIHCSSMSAGNCAAGLAAPGNNPGATSASGSAFIPAGAPFSATVTAKNASGAATPNFGQETSPASVTLTPTLVAPAGGDDPPIATGGSGSGFGAYSGGSATGTAFSWPEVGIITLTPSVSSYLGSGPVTGTTSPDIGRFYPSSFGVTIPTAPVFGTGCMAGGFSYVGQPLTFTVAPVANLAALTAGGGIAKNYTGAFMKLSNATLTGRTYTPTPASPALNLAGLPPSSADPSIADLGLSQPSQSGNVTLTFSAGSGIAYVKGSAISPFNANIALSINVIDADGVVPGGAFTNPITFGAGSGIAFSSGATQYYGRLALRDSVGSELLNLPAPLTTQYYANTSVGFTTNTADSCTSAPALAFSNYQLNLTSNQSCVLDTGKPGVSGQGCASPASNALRYDATAVAGNFNLNLAAPGSGHNGAVTVTATAPSWLQFPWSGGSNPSAIATFGEFPAPASRVYQREVY